MGNCGYFWGKIATLLTTQIQGSRKIQLLNIYSKTRKKINYI